MSVETVTYSLWGAAAAAIASAANVTLFMMVSTGRERMSGKGNSERLKASRRWRSATTRVKSDGSWTGASGMRERRSDKGARVKEERV